MKRNRRQALREGSLLGRAAVAATLACAVLVVVGCRSTPITAPVEERSPGRPATSVPAPPAAPAAGPVIVDRSIPPGGGAARGSGAGPAVAVPGAAAAGEGRYTVQRGDTLHSIAMATGRDARDLARWNNLEDPNRIVAGQVLRVDGPAAEAAGGGATVPAAVSSGVPAGATGAAAAAVPGPGRVESRPLEAGSAAAASSAPVPAAPVAGAPVAGSGPGGAAAPAAPAQAAAGTGESTFAWPSRGRVIERFDESRNKGIDIAGNEGDPVLAAADGQVVYVGNGLRGYGNLLIVKHGEEFITAYAHNRAVLVKQGDTIRRGQRVAELGRTDADQPKLHFEIRRQGKPVDPLLFLPAR